MWKGGAVVFAASMIVCGCAGSANQVRPQAAAEPTFLASMSNPEVSRIRELTTAEKKIITEGISRTLKDPGSIQVRWLLFPDLHDKNKSVPYCGAMNAKNSYGAYIGFKPFLAQILRKDGKITGAVLVSAPGTYDADIREAADREVCFQHGYDADQAL